MQKKRAPALFLALALMLSLAVSAAPRYNVTTRCVPILRISGGTATCGLSVDAQRGAEIKGTLTLYRGSTQEASWKISGTTYVDFSDKVTNLPKGTYKLVADLTVTKGSQSDEVYEYVTKEYR